MTSAFGIQLAQSWSDSVDKVFFKKFFKKQQKEEKLILEISINVIVFKYNWETPPKTTLFNLAFNIGRKIAVVNIVFVINTHTFYILYGQSLEHEY